MCRLPAFRRRFPAAVLATVLGLFLLPGLARSEEARSDLRRCFPASGLIAYAEFDGLRAHTKAWEATAAYAMLARTPAGSMMTDLATQVIDRLVKLDPSIKWTGADLVALEDHVVHEGFAIGYRRAGDDDSIILVLRAAGQPASRERFERILGLADARGGREKNPAVSKVRGREMFRWMSTMTAIPADDPVAPLRGGGVPESRLSAWFEKDDLVLVASVPSDHVVEPGKQPDDTNGRDIATVLDTSEGKQPNVSTHPGYASAVAEGKDVTGFEGDGLFFIELGENLGALKEGLSLRAMGEAGGILSGPDGLKLPSGRYMNDDVKFFNSSPDFPWANTQAAAQRARMRAMGVEPPPAQALPVAPSSLPDVAQDGGPPVTAAPPVGLTAPEAPSPAIAGLPAPPLAVDAATAPEGPPPPFAAMPAPPPSPAGVGLPSPSSTKAVPPRQASKPAEPEKAPDAIKALGLDSIKRIVGRWGFHGKALLTDVRVEIPAPRKGLAGWIDQPGFDRDRLFPVPDRARSFTVDSLDPALLYTRLADLGKTIDPDSARVTAELERMIRGAIGIRIREDLLAQIGPSWSVFPAPSAERNDKDELDPWDYVLVAELKDAGAFAKTLDTLAARASDYLREREKPKGAAAPAAGQADLPAVVLERLPAPHRGYRLTSPSRVVFWLDEEIQPAILVGQSHVAFASTPERAVEALAFEQGAERRWKPAGEVEQALACLPRKLTLLSVGDPDESSVPGLLAHLPQLVQMMGTALELEALDGGEGKESGDLLTMLGIPGRGSFRVRLDPARVPTFKALRAQLFPSVLAAAVDERGIRFIASEAFPLGCLGTRTSISSSLKWSGGRWKRDLKLGLKMFSD